MRKPPPSKVQKASGDADGAAGLQQAVREAMRGEITGLFDELRRFVDRRILELSTELHAALELVDVSEHHLSAQLQQVRGVLSRLVALPASATRHSGLELQGVVQATEDAANNIMTAAEMIRDAVDAPDGREVILEQVGAIFEACEFQDLTGYRVRRMLEQLRLVESELAFMAEETAAEARLPRPEPRRDVPVEGPELSQDEIDKLFIPIRRSRPGSADRGRR